MDQVCVTMPTNTRDFMAAASVTQDYLLQLALGSQKGMRPKNYEVTFRMDERFKFFEPCLKVVKDNNPLFDYTGWDELRRGDFDCFMEFDVERAWEATKLSAKHITEAFGILIGSSPSSRYPLQSNKLIKPVENKVKEPCSVSLLQWTDSIYETQKFQKFLADNYPQLNIHLVEVESEDPEIVFDYTKNFDVVVGRSTACGTTYAAAALGKALIEIFPNQKEATLYNNFDLEVYQQVIGTEVSAEVMWTAWESKWPDIERSFTTKLVKP